MTTNGTSHTLNGTSTMLETTFLIVGAGPAGASIGSFLAYHNMTGIMISAAPGTAKEPRAHITNPAALETLRALGLEQEVLKLASPTDNLQHMRWCRSMAGQE